MTFNWIQPVPWRWALVDAATDTSVSTVLNDGGKWERHGHEYASLEDAKASLEGYAQLCMNRHGKLPDVSHR